MTILLPSITISIFVALLIQPITTPAHCITICLDGKPASTR